VTRWLRPFLRLTPIVAGACALSVVGLIAFRAIVPLADLRASDNNLGNYLQTIGGIYAVLLAFVVFVVWGQFNDGRTFVAREATALVDLHRTVSGLPVATRTEIQSGLRAYLDAVLADEWRAMARRDDATIDRVGHLLDDVWLAIHRCRPSNDCQHTIYGEVLRQFNELTDLRTSRLTSARSRIPQSMRILLFTGAVLVIGSMWLVIIPALWLHAMVTAALAGAISHILYLIVDLDAAFDGGSDMISKEPFEHARHTFARDTHCLDVD
jgi:hypothetical protein